MKNESSKREWYRLGHEAANRVGRNGLIDHVDEVVDAVLWRVVQNMEEYAREAETGMIGDPPNALLLTEDQAFAVARHLRRFASSLPVTPKETR